MSRRSIVIITVLGAIAGAAAALGSMAIVAWRIALSTQQHQLDRDALLALTHVEHVYEDAVRTLYQISATNARPCSPEHIKTMLQLTESSLEVVNIAYGTGDIIECNSWGILPYILKRAAFHLTQPDGIGLVLNWRPISFGTDRSMLIARLNGYSVLVDQRRFFRDWGGSGSVIADVRASDGTPLRASYVDRGTVYEIDDAVATSSNVPAGWTVTVRQPRIKFTDSLLAERVLLFPLSITLGALFAVIAILWLRWRLSLRGELGAAVRNGEINAHYQPIVELATGRCWGAEALARWRRADGSQVPPDVFIPLAEATGLIANITDQMVRAVVTDLGDWLRSDPYAHVGVNLSAVDVSSGRILGVLEGALEGSGIKSEQIWLEVTERGIIDLAGAKATLAELFRRGHPTAIDDFGTGYAGLTYLQQLPIVVLKIDRSFVDVVGTEAPTRDVTEHIIAMAKEFKLNIVAEGVETEKQAAYFRDKGVSFAQGWLFSRPLPAEEFLDFCASNRREYGGSDLPLPISPNPV